MTAFAMVLLALTGMPEMAVGQAATCPVAEEPSNKAGPADRSMAARLRDPNPLIREMTRAGQLYDNGQREEAVAIYRKLAAARPDPRQTARRAKLKLAQAALASSDFATAESLLREAGGRGALPELQTRSRKLSAQLEQRRGIAASEAALAEVDGMAAANRTDEAIKAAQALLGRSCPFSADYPSRVKIRLAQLYRAKGDFAGARAMTADALASAATPRGRERATLVMGEIEAAATVAGLRATVAEANGFIDAGDPNRAIALLEPLLAQPVDPELDKLIRLRLSRAYAQAQQLDEAVAVTQPLLARAALEPAEYEAIARTSLARAAHLQDNGKAAEAAQVYREVLEWTPPLPAEVRNSARLGLARTLARQGDRTAALELIEEVRSDNPSPALAARANNLFADLQNDIPLNRLVGYVEAGIAYDTNAPALVSAIRDVDDDTSFPADQKFGDFHARLAGRLQYHHQLGQGTSYLDLSAYALRTIQFDLPELDRTRVALRAGPALSLAGGNTQLLLGGQFDGEWRADRFRYSEPGGYVGFRHQFNGDLSATGIYSLVWHNDYRDERDGIKHAAELQLRKSFGAADDLTIELLGERQGARLEHLRYWSLLAGASLRHRWLSEGPIVPFVEAGIEGERQIYDGTDPAGQSRRDWKLNVTAAAGADVARNWRLSLRYAYFDLTSNILSRSRLPNHQVALIVRFSWN